MDRPRSAAADAAPLRPLRDGLFAFDDEGRATALLGTRCRDCGAVAFPARAMCHRCGPSGRLQPHRLATEGVVHVSTVVRVASALGHRPPYACGYVDLPADGTRVFAPFAGAAVECFAPGRPVRVAFTEIAAPSLPGVLGYVFVPAPKDGLDG